MLVQPTTLQTLQHKRSQQSMIVQNLFGHIKAMSFFAGCLNVTACLVKCLRLVMILSSTSVTSLSKKEPCILLIFALLSQIML